MAETISLKALANAVLLRDDRRDGHETLPSHDGETGVVLVRQPETLDEATVAHLRATHQALSADARARLRAEADAGDQLAAMILRAVLTPPATAPCAWRLYSRRLDREVWIVKNTAALAELVADDARGGLPIVMADDLAPLRRLDDLTLNAVLDTCARWPRARVADALVGHEGGK